MSSPQPSTLFHRDQPVEDIEGRLVQLTPIDTETISNNTVLRSALKTKKLLWKQRSCMCGLRFQCTCDLIHSWNSDSKFRLKPKRYPVKDLIHTYLLTVRHSKEKNTHAQTSQTHQRGRCQEQGFMSNISPKSYPMNLNWFFKHSAASFCVAQLSEPGDKGLDPKLLQASWVGMGWVLDPGRVGKGLYAVPRACVVSQFALGSGSQAPNTSSLAHPICHFWCFHWCFHWCSRWIWQASWSARWEQDLPS